MARVGRSRRISFLTALLLFAAAAVTYPNDNDNRLSVFLDGSWVFPIGLAFHPGAELSLYSFNIDDVSTLRVGAAVTGQIAFATRVDLWSFTTFGAAISPLLILSFDGGSDSPGTGAANGFLRRLEFSLSPGIGFNYYIYAGDPAYYINRGTFEVGFAGFAGVRFRICRLLLIRLDATYWGRYIGPNAAIGIQLELW